MELQTLRRIPQSSSTFPRFLPRSEDSQSFAEQPLEGIESNEWFCFEHALVVNDLPSGGVHSFLHQEDARSFRTLMYANHGKPSSLLRPSLD